jgi:hypothetical protein
MASPASPTRLADHFPRVEKKCASVAKPFFDCFTEASKMQNEDVIFIVFCSVCCFSTSAQFVDLSVIVCLFS